MNTQTNFVTLNNGIKMPYVGLGVFRVTQQDEAAAAVSEALASGYKSIDTAAIYGNEEGVGAGIKQSGVKREEIFLTTKLWNEVQRTGNVYDAFQESLDKMGVDYVDLYLIHWPVKEKYCASWEAMMKIYESKRARAIGVSNFNIHHLEDILAMGGVVPAVNQFECHPQLSQTELTDYCKSKGIQPEAWSPLGAAKNGLFENEAIVSIAKKYGKSPAQVILRWDIQRGIVTIPKSTNPGRIKENLNIFDFSLTDDDMSAINSLNENKRVGSDPETFTF